LEVQCKYCHVEYEVDDERLDGASVIQCVNCGLKFEVGEQAAPEQPGDVGAALASADLAAALTQAAEQAAAEQAAAVEEPEAAAAAEPVAAEPATAAEPVAGEAAVAEAEPEAAAEEAAATEADAAAVAEPAEEPAAEEPAVEEPVAEAEPAAEAEAELAEEPAAEAPAAEEEPAAEPARPPRARTQPMTGGAVRRWFLKSPDGELREVPELTMLQKWIFTGLVARDWDISVDGETWKPLGNIDELEPFFGFAEEASAAWEDAASATLSLVKAQEERRTASEVGGKESSAVELSLDELEPVEEQAGGRRAGTVQGLPPPVPPAEPESPDWFLVDDEEIFEVLHPEFAGVNPTPPPLPPPKPKKARADSSAEGEMKPRKPAPEAKDGWGIEVISSSHLIEEYDDAIEAEKVQTQKVTDDAVVEEIDAPKADEGVARKHPPPPKPPPKRALPADLPAKRKTERDPWELDNRPPPLRKPAPAASNAGLVRGLAVVGVIGLLFGIYWFGLRDRSPAQPTARAPVVEPPVVAPPAAPPDAQVALSRDEVLAMAREAVIVSEESALRRARLELGNLAADDEVAIAQSRVAAALAQLILDRAALAGGENPRNDTEVETLAAEAVDHAALVLAKDGDNLAAKLAHADGRRLRGDKAGAIRQALRAARKADQVELALIQAKTYQRERDFRRARRELDKVVSDTDAAGDPRPRSRLALLALLAGDLDDADKQIAALRETHTDYPRTAQLASALDKARKVAAAATEPTGDDDDDDSSGGATASDGESYDELVKKAGRRADSGACKEAIDLYSRALDKKPRSVTALVGVGFCYIEVGSMSRALSSFNSALRISPKNTDALTGVAETYTQQGNKAKAIETYKKILAIHPTGYYAKIATRQIKMLGGTVPEAPKPDAPVEEAPKPDAPVEEAPKPDAPKPATNGSEGEDGAGAGDQG
jgi:hypothetical protein